MAWRDRWAMKRDFKMAMQQQSKSKKKILPTINSNLRRTVGVLSTQDEEGAIFYDNPRYDADPDRNMCTGYFGIHMLHLPPPPNASASDCQLLVLIHGDFNGVKIFNSLRDAVHSPSGEVEQPDRFVSLGDDDLGGQVLSLIHVDSDCLPAWTTRGGHTISPPCCFIGFASGRVAAVSLIPIVSLQHVDFFYLTYFSMTHRYLQNSQMTSDNTTTPFPVTVKLMILR